MDIARAIFFGYPYSDKPSLVLRRIKCFLFLNVFDKAADVIEDFEQKKPGSEALVAMRDLMVKYESKKFEEPAGKYVIRRTPECPILENPRKDIPELSDAVDIVKIEGKGRGWKATRDIMPGTLQGHFYKKKLYSRFQSLSL